MTYPEWRGIRQQGLGGLWDAVEAGWCGQAVTTTEWNIALAGDDEDRSLDWVLGSSSTANGEKLTDGHWLAGHERNREDLWVEVARGEEVDLDGAWRGWSQISVGVGCKSCCLVGLDKVSAKQEEWNERAILGETGQTKAIGDLGEHGSQCVAGNC